MGRSEVIDKIETRASKTIQAIYDLNGGTRNSSRICGYSAELLSTWKKNGQVPLRKVAEIAKALRCNPYDLNYEEVLALVTAVGVWGKAAQ